MTIRTETKVITYATFEGLTEDKQQEVIDKNRDINTDHHWWDGVYDDAETIGLNITIFNIEGSFKTDANDCATAIIENHGKDCETYKLAENFLTAYNKNMADLLTLETYLDKAIAADDDKAQEAITILISDGEDCIDFLEQEFLKDLLDAYMDILRKEEEYLSSDEAIRETLISNDYEFNTETLEIA